MRNIKIGDRHIGSDDPCFIIAEAGVNHNGSMDLARQLVAIAKDVGADAVKFQAFFTNAISTRLAPKAGYQAAATGNSEGQYAMLRSLELTMEQQKELKDHCASIGIQYLCTPYDKMSVDLLEAIGVDAYKIASTDTNNLPLLRYIATKGRPVILSTGMATLGEVEQALAALTSENNIDVLVLHCTSEYPAPIDEVNLRAIRTLRLATGYPVGFSDHTEGISAGQWAVALGAVALEKHFTIDRSLPGPDHTASAEPDELRQYVKMVRQVELALGDGKKRPSRSELKNKMHMRKSIVAMRPLTAGHLLQQEDLACKRPGSGLAPEWFDRLLGQRLAIGLAEDEQITLSSIAWRSESAK